MQDSNPDQWKRDETPTSFFNPLYEDLEIPYLNEDNVPVNYFIPAIKISTYPKYMADYFIKHIVDEIINKRNLGYLSPEKRAEIEKECAIE